MPLDSTLFAPRSALAWAPVLWSNVLFPGTDSESQRSRPLAWFIFLALPALLLYPCMSFYLFEPDEGRYAEIPREMLQRGEWVVPYLQDEPYLDKPPLLYWLVMASYLCFGIHDWAARLVPALAVHATILATYGLGRKAVGEKAAFRGTLALTLMPSLMGVGRLLTMDSLLTLWVTVAVWCAYIASSGPTLRRGWWLLAGLAAGLGLLAKGPIALILIVPPLWAHRRLSRSGAPVGWRDRGLFLSAALGVALPWYVALLIANPTFARHFFWEHNVQRFLAPFDHLEPIWYYLPILAVGLLPATLGLVPFVRYLGTADSKAAATRTPALGFVLLSGSWCLLFFSLSGCKLPTYILPSFSFLALAFGHCLRWSDWGAGRCVRWCLGAALAVQALTHYVVVPWYAQYRSPTAQWTELAAQCDDRAVPVVCYPRMCYSVAFYLGREDIRAFRSKEIDKLRLELRTHPKTVMLLGHRHSLPALGQALPPYFELLSATHFGLAPIPGLPKAWDRAVAKLMGETPLDLCDLVVVQPAQPRGFEAADEGAAPIGPVPPKSNSWDWRK
jgi:4-amino-4-deoxy-L-arabinose transferase-like glycosyltransferase